MSVVVKCPVCSGVTSKICRYDNHRHTTSLKFVIKGVVARLGWLSLTGLGVPDWLYRFAIIRKFSVGIFRSHDIRRCDECSLGFVYPDISAAALTLFYRYTYWTDHRRDVHISHADAGNARSKMQYDLLRRHIDFSAVSYALEIGPGPGCISHRIRENHPHISFEAIEPSAEWTRNHAASDVFSTVYTAISEVADSARFDLILSSHSLEHVADLAEFMRHIRRILAPRSYMFIEVPNCTDAYFATSNRDLPHTYFFTSTAITRLATKFGFSVLALGSWERPWTAPEEVPRASGDLQPNTEGSVLRAVLALQKAVAGNKKSLSATAGH